MGEPVPEVMIRHEQGRGQDPCDRIDQQHGLRRVVQRHHHEQPRDAEHDRTDNREEHGPQALAGPANGARRVVDDRVEQVKRRDEVNHRGGVGHDRRVVDEEAREGLDEREEEQRHAPDDPDRDDERDVVSAPHALVVARSEVLRGKRRHGDAERLGDHPDDPVQTGGEPHPVTASAPKEFTVDCTMMLEIEYNDDWTTSGRPVASMLRQRHASITTYRRAIPILRKARKP